MASRIVNEDKPNIVFILSDDHGAWAMGNAGNQDIHTPHLDALAETGVRFDNFFCTSPVCSPARASILTGKLPSQNGVHDWISDGNIGDRPIEYLEKHLAYTDILAENGYTCGLSGKWHLGHSRQPQKSHSHWYVHQQGGGTYYDAPMVKNGELINEPGYVTDNITDDAVAFIENHYDDDSPFYLGIHYTAPHSPWIGNHPKELIDLYEDCKFESCPQEPIHPWSIELTHEVQKAPFENLKGYYAAVTGMDRGIGSILKQLETLGIKENTLVCYMADNGFSCGQHGFWGKGNGTFPLNMYDTSVKVPFIMNHPGTIPAGQVNDDMLSQYDFMPTLLDYVGIEHAYTETLPGNSFVPELMGESTQNRDHVIVFDEYGPVRMIRTKKWKYIHRYPYGPHELYNLENDCGERKNLIDDKRLTDKVNDLRQRLEKWFITYVDPNYDGVHQSVTGEGQRGLSGIYDQVGHPFVNSKI